MWNGSPSLTSLSQVHQVRFKAIYRNQQWQKVLNLKPCMFFEVKNLIFRNFPKIWKFNNSCDVIKSILGQKGSKFVYYIATVMKRSNLITMDFLRQVIHFWGQFSKTVILWPIPNYSFWRHSITGSKETQIGIIR